VAVGWLCSLCSDDLVGAEVIDEADETSTIVSSSEKTLSVCRGVSEVGSEKAEFEFASDEACWPIWSMSNKGESRAEW